MSRSNSIVKQASILALAGILVRIIGLLYRSPLTAMILDEGNGYYSTAYNIYALVLLISSYSIPTAISKLISEKIALKEYKNVKRILKCVFIYVCAIAGSAAILLFILAPFIVDVNAVPALRVLCPTIFLSGLLGVFRGYFQAHKTTIYTSVSQIIEQIFNAVVALLAAYIFIQPYLGVDATKVGSYGAAGSALGTGAGVLVGLIYMIFMYLKKKNTFVEEKDEEASERVDSYQEIFRIIMHIIAPIILATCVYNLVTTIDMYIFYFAQSFHHIDKITYISNYGVYAGKYIVLQNVPVALASAMSTASIPSISSAWALGNVKEAKTHITSGLSVTMLILSRNGSIILSNHGCFISSKSDNYDSYIIACFRISSDYLLWFINTYKWDLTSFRRSECSIKKCSIFTCLSHHHYCFIIVYYTFRGLCFSVW